MGYLSWVFWGKYHDISSSLYNLRFSFPADCRAYGVEHDEDLKSVEGPSPTGGQQSRAPQLPGKWCHLEDILLGRNGIQFTWQLRVEERPEAFELMPPTGTFISWIHSSEFRNWKQFSPEETVAVWHASCFGWKPPLRTPGQSPSTQMELTSSRVNNTPYWVPGANPGPYTW